MNGASDKPASVLIGMPDEDASGLPLQLPRSSARQPRQIPHTGILKGERDASSGMSPSYPGHESETQGRPCYIRITGAHVARLSVPASRSAVPQLRYDIYLHTQ